MTVSSTTNKSGPYLGNGSTVEFDYEFRILDPSHVTVIMTQGGVDTIVSPSDYTVSGVGAAPGGALTFLTAPVTGQSITIIRNAPFTQPTDLENQGAYYAETVEGALDLGVMRDQQLAEGLSRAVQIPVGADTGALTGLIEDIIRLSDSADEIDTVAGIAAQVSTVAGMASEIIAAPAYAAAAAASAASAGNSAIAAAAAAAVAGGSYVPKFHAVGGQMAALNKSLNDPLEQITGIVLIGDSITWGATLPDNAVTTPRDGTLSDPRDNFASGSWANLLKRYLGAQYAGGAAPSHSNWPASPSGQAITEYVKSNALYPNQMPFTIASSGSALSIVEANSTGPCGRQVAFNDGNAAGTSYYTIRFPFTGTAFDLHYASIAAAHNMDYELRVNGVLIGTYSTTPGEGGNPAGTAINSRTHTFGYVRNKIVEIRSKYRVASGSTGQLRLEAVVVNKIIRITNQGINGLTTAKYLTYNLSGSFGDGVAVGPQDNFVLVQLGTNDRIIADGIPKGPSTLEAGLNALLDVVEPKSQVILMCANPTAPEDPAVYSFTMQDARATIARVAYDRSLDFVDNYEAFYGMSTNDVLADGLHPNAAGHAVMHGNVIAALRSASQSGHSLERSVDEFGAKGAGGDDTAGLQAAFTHIATHGGVLRLEAKRYRITAGLSISNAAKPFRIIGAGKKATEIVRAGSGVGSVVSVSLSNDWEITDLSIDAGFSTFPTNANHGIVWFDCSRVRTRRIHVTNWKNSAIIGYVAAPTIAGPQFEDGVIDDCTCDGGDTANNGFLVVDMARSGIRNSNALNIGKTGSPCYALQVKNGGQDCFIENSYGSGASVGLAIGNNDTSIGTALRTRLLNSTVYNCTTGVALGENNRVTGANINIDMAGQGQAAIDFNLNTKRCVFTGIKVSSLAAGKPAVRFRSGDEMNSVQLGVVGRASGVSPVVEFLSGSLNNYVQIDCIEGGATDSDALVSDLSTGSTNVFEYAPLPNRQTAVLVSDAIRLRHGKITAVRVDTEASAATDNLATINGGADGQIITVNQNANARDVTVKHGTGNIRLSGAADLVFTLVNQNVTLMYVAGISQWCEVSRGTAV